MSFVSHGHPEDQIYVLEFLTSRWPCGESADCADGMAVPEKSHQRGEMAGNVLVVSMRVL